MKQLTDSQHIQGTLTILTYQSGTLVRQSQPMKNKVVSSDTHGRNLIIRHLSGDTTYPLVIDSASLGDDDTAPADGDTDLGNPISTGNLITDKVVTNDTLRLDVFIASANLPDGTYRELGFFCGAQLFSRIIIDPAHVKAAGEQTLFRYTLPYSG